MIEVKATIRETDDVDAVKELDARCFPLDYREDFSDQWCWLATVDGEPVGFSAYKIEDGVPHITRMGVLPQFRGMKLQRRFAHILAQHARRKGFDKIETFANITNIPSLRNLIGADYRLTKAWQCPTTQSWFQTVEKKLT